MLEDELRHLLRELIDATCTPGASVVHERPDIADRNQVVPLGHGAYLRLFFNRPHSDETSLHEHAAALERSARALRACARRWEVARVPEMTQWRSDTGPTIDRIAHRITAFLQALNNTQHAIGSMVTVRGRVVASIGELQDIHSEQLPFTIRRLAAEAARQRRSHGELVGEDYYAVSFWLDACLIAFFSGPYAVDFFRHRARLVTRELAQLLPMLDEPPPAPANVAPLPE